MFNKDLIIADIDLTIVYSNTYNYLLNEFMKIFPKRNAQLNI